MKKGNVFFKETHLTKSEKTKLQKTVGIFLIISFSILIVFLIYLVFFYIKPCDSKECFDNAMQDCQRVFFIKEDNQASWSYKIFKANGVDSCMVEVKLLKLNQGKIDSEILEDKKMICNVLKAETQYPEKDISVCTGAFKEELQNLLIQRMHSYLLENVGEIREGFQEI